jgi:ferric-dicitrate binding protein FerR (iron transport regulator)
MNHEQRLLMIDALIDGSISDPDRLRIEAEMIVDPEVRMEYYRRVQLSALLGQETNDLTTPPESSLATDRRAIGRPATGWIKVALGPLLAIAASLLVLAALNPHWFRIGRVDTISSQQRSEGAKTEAEPSASGFAILNGQDSAVWSDTSFREGDLLPSGELHLRSGLAHIELFSGVQVVLEGESRFTIDSPMQITLVQGIARAQVPEPAQGFRIKTASGDVVDLGTEFSVNVDQSGADIHVIDGEVELHPHTMEALRIDAGRSLRLAGSEGVVDVHSHNNDSIGPTEFQNLARKSQQRRYDAWSTWQTSVATDPRLVAFYRLNSDRFESRFVDNLATGARDRATDGTIVAAGSAADRWGRSDAALDFSPVGSRVRVHVPGEHRGLTLACWVKINSLDRWYNSLFLTDGHEDREPHWQLMDDGRIFFSVKVPREDQPTAGKQPIYYSPSIWNPSLSGRWIMLAVTYDVDLRQVTHYLNGKPISTEAIDASSLVESIRVGHASICNWSEPMYSADPDFVLRNLNGTMDEFAMFSGPLTADEVLKLYDRGNPNE